MKHHTATARVLEIIEVLSQSSSSTIDNLVKKTSIPYTTIYRILQTCVRLRFVDLTEDHCYQLSQKLFHITATYLHEQCPLSVIAHPSLQKLYRYTKETIHLGILEKYKVLYVDKIETQHKIRMHSYIGYQAEIHCTGLGKIITAYLNETEQSDIIKNISFPKYTPHTITSTYEFSEEIKKIKVQGFAEDNEENESHLYCIAVPIFDNHNNIIGALSMSAVLFRFDMTKKHSTIQKMWSCAEEISNKLGNNNYFETLGIQETRVQ